MLKTLTIKNLILIEEAQLEFKEGFTVITGETGAGKTALVEAIRLLLGERADSNKVRKGSEKAFVQASFELSRSPMLESLFDSLGVSYDFDEDLILARELSNTNKSRAFLAGSQVPSKTLQILAPYITDFISQHAQILLKDTENQQILLDQFATVSLAFFQSLWKEEKSLHKELENLKQKKATSEARKELLKEEIEELTYANVKESEDEELFEEYSLLSNSQEFLARSSEVLEYAEPSFASVGKMQTVLEKMQKTTSSLDEALQMVQDAHFQIADLIPLVQSFQAKVEADPSRLMFLEERLKLLDSLKKRYGKNLTEILADKEKELFSIDNLDEEIQQFAKKLAAAEKKTTEAAETLTNQRKAAAAELEKILSRSLSQLNIPNAEVTIACEKAHRSPSGEDSIEFFLRANLGEQKVAVKDSSSGGELSRMLLAIKVALADKNPRKTMIFDEIDANIGGETANKVGSKLKELGKNHQVLCITHFPQVASAADHHFRVIKNETGGRTTCLIEPLSPSAATQELQRMVGYLQSE